MAAKLSRWVIFTILFSLIPLCVDFFAEVIFSKGVFELSNFGRHGELYLLAAATCAVGLGEVIGVNQRFVVPKIIAAGSSLLVIAVATALYTLSASDAAKVLLHAAGTHTATDELFTKPILAYSPIMFVVACILSTSCIALSEVESDAR